MIEFKYDERFSVFFKPLENGKNEYYVEVHDFTDLSCIRQNISYEEFLELNENPRTWLGY